MIYFIVIGYAKNTYVGINKIKGSTKGLMSLSKPNILTKDEPNEIHVRVDKGNFIQNMSLNSNKINLSFSDGFIEIIVNKYDSFHVNDTSYPIKVEYISFASYDTAPMEFYYNCSSSFRDPRSIKNSTQIKSKSNFSSIQHSSEAFVKQVYLNNIRSFSLIDFGILATSILTLSINIIELYFIYLFSKYLDS